MIFLILTSIIFTLITVFVPKRLSPIELYASAFSALVLQEVVDIYLEIKLRWYYYLREDDIEWSCLFIIPIYIGVNVLSLNFFPFHKSKFKQGLYIAICVFISIIYEYFALKFKMLQYNEWKLWYSTICYFLLFPLLSLNLKWIRLLVNKSI
ncbi:hypothetical protein [Bacillus sp. ISL-46]|uniref:hypothetical protein n=1 Tax=Bacillus sp. ISL-46 TaxID=2819129 RepID=UPI001BE6EAB4|nr:hypothetical protein [Bacillus sp. ISL-46]MBT2724511.1 hypothetical protein [Bacillus sp. ISL-46]